MLGDGLAQKAVALLGAVAVEGFGGRQIVHRGVHGLHHRRRQGLGDVPDAHADERSLRVGLLVGGGAAGYFGEQVAAGQLLEMRVHMSHGGLLGAWARISFNGATVAIQGFRSVK